MGAAVSAVDSAAPASLRIPQLRLAICTAMLAVVLAAPAEATVNTNTTSAAFGSLGTGVCRGAAVGVAGYEPGQVVVAHPVAGSVGTIESGWTGRLQVTAIPGPAADQVGYKVCNVATASTAAPKQAILLAAVTGGSGQSTAVVERNFGSIAGRACLTAVESVPGAQTDAAVTAQPDGAVAAAYAASGGLQVSAFPGPDSGQVTLKACNVTGAAINPPAQGFLLGSFPASTPGAATNTLNLSYGSLAAGSCYRQSFGVPGATPEDAVIANPLSPVGTGYSGKFFVTSLGAEAEATDEGTYKACNLGTSALTPPSQNFRVMALHPPTPPCDPSLDLECGEPPACDPLLDLSCDPCGLEFEAEGCTAPVQRQKPRCGGRRATIIGTRRADSLKGTKRRDVIAARGGRDTVRGLGGDDLICGGPGNDKLLGGPGKDRLLGEGGDDRLFGGPGADRCVGGKGKDHTSGCRRKQAKRT